MGQSASKIAEAETKSEAQAKPRQASLQSETAVDASPQGQPGEATRSLTSRPKDAIYAEEMDDLNLEAPHRKLPRHLYCLQLLLRPAGHRHRV
jgi:hypothetical protein